MNNTLVRGAAHAGRAIVPAKNRTSPQAALMQLGILMAKLSRVPGSRPIAEQDGVGKAIDRLLDGPLNATVFHQNCRPLRLGTVGLASELDRFGGGTRHNGCGLIVGGRQ
jgi:hypothetical protein